MSCRIGRGLAAVSLPGKFVFWKETLCAAICQQKLNPPKK
jgi:hypothetical protein